MPYLKLSRQIDQSISLIDAKIKNCKKELSVLQEQMASLISGNFTISDTFIRENTPQTGNLVINPLRFLHIKNELCSLELEKLFLVEKLILLSEQNKTYIDKKYSSVRQITSAVTGMSFQIAITSPIEKLLPYPNKIKTQIEKLSPYPNKIKKTLTEINLHMPESISTAIDEFNILIKGNIYKDMTICIPEFISRKMEKNGITITSDDIKSIINWIYLEKCNPASNFNKCDYKSIENYIIQKIMNEFPEKIKDTDSAQRLFKLLRYGTTLIPEPEPIYRGMHESTKTTIRDILKPYSTLVEEYGQLSPEIYNNLLFRFKNIYKSITGKDFEQNSMEYMDPKVIEELLTYSFKTAKVLTKIHTPPFKTGTSGHITKGRKIVFKTTEGQSIVLECHDYVEDSSIRYVMRVYNDTTGIKKDTRSYLRPDCKLSDNSYRDRESHILCGEFGKQWIEQA